MMKIVCQSAVHPPSIVSVDPVICLAASLQMYATSSAICMLVWRGIILTIPASQPLPQLILEWDKIV